MGSFERLGPFEVPSFPARAVTVYRSDALEARSPSPVLYVFDGQNAFSDQGGQPGWYLQAAIDSLNTRTEIVPLVVAIPHGGQSRADELTPWVTDGWGGRAAEFLTWIVEGLAPRIARAFPVIPGPVGSALCGASWGAITALYGHFAHPQAFGGALCLSPSFWVGRGRAFELVAHSPLPPISRMYVDCGSLEDGGQMLLNAHNAVDVLRRRGYAAERLMWLPVANADHSELEWRKRLPNALKFMYRRQ